MSPSRLSAGITIGDPLDEISRAKVASISWGSYCDVGMAGRRRVHLLLQHPLVDRADGVLRAAEDLRTHPLRLTERELRHGRADSALDPLGAKRDLVVAGALAPLLRAVGVTDGHPHDRDRGVDAAERARRPGSGGRCGRSPCRRSPPAGSGSASRRRPCSSGVTVAALSPRPCSRIAWPPRARLRCRWRDDFRATDRSGEARSRTRSRPDRADAGRPRAAPGPSGRLRERRLCWSPSEVDSRRAQRYSMRLTRRRNECVKCRLVKYCRSKRLSGVYLLCTGGEECTWHERRFSCVTIAGQKWRRGEAR